MKLDAERCWRDPLLLVLLVVITVAALVSMLLLVSGDGTAAEARSLGMAEAEARCDTLVAAARAGKLDTVYIWRDSARAR